MTSTEQSKLTSNATKKVHRMATLQSRQIPRLLQAAWGSSYVYVPEVCGNDYCCSHSREIIPIPIFPTTLFPFPSPAITIFSILERREMCIYSVIYSKQKLPSWQVTPEALYIIILSHCYSSLVSQLSVNYVRCSSVTACCYAKQDFFYKMCYSHSHSH